MKCIATTAARCSTVLLNALVAGVNRRMLTRTPTSNDVIGEVNAANGRKAKCSVDCERAAMKGRCGCCSRISGLSVWSEVVRRLGSYGRRAFGESIDNAASHSAKATIGLLRKLDLASRAIIDRY